LGPLTGLVDHSQHTGFCQILKEPPHSFCTQPRRPEGYAPVLPALDGSGVSCNDSRNRHD
jgi:hypothetical protein